MTRARRWLGAAALAAASVAATATPVASQSTTTTAPATGRLVLESQTSWVAVGGEFDLSMRATGVRDASNLEVAVSVYRRVTSRSEFDQTLRDTTPASSPLTVVAVPLTSLTPDAAGNLTVRLFVQDPALPREADRVKLGAAGVYPVRVELREQGGGDVVDRFTTHLVYTPANPGTKLDVAWVLRVHATPSLRTDGTRQLAAMPALLDLAQSIDPGAGAPAVPLTIAPTPETLEALQTLATAPTPDERAEAAITALRRALDGRQLVVGPYVPVNLPALQAAGLANEAAAQLTRGADTVNLVLGVRPDTRTWLGEDALDEPALVALRDLGDDQIVLPESALAPISQRVTPTRPFVLEARLGRRQEAAVADAGLAAHFTNGDNAVLRAHQFLADLAVVYFDEPGSGPRGVVALTPRSWQPVRAFLDIALDGLARSPIVEPVTLDTLLTEVPNAKTARGAPLVRRLATTSGSGSADASALAVRHRLDAFSSMLDPGNKLFELLDEQLLVSESADLRSAHARAAYVTAVERGIETARRRVQVPRGRSITLTSHEGKIPITFRKETDFPVHVVVHVTSDKLEAPARPQHRLEVDEPLYLTKENTTERYSVVARTSGTFPLDVTLESPEGGLVVGRTRLVVRSTATSIVGLVLTFGAALFLLVWWARHVLHGRRARRLVPA